MEETAHLLESVDTPWSAIALFFVGFFLLLWKYGGELLSLTRDTNRKAQDAVVVAEDAKAKTQEIADSIITNHGSKNLGDAVDRLTEGQGHTNELIMRHLIESNEIQERLHRTLSDFDERLTKLETA